LRIATAISPQLRSAVVMAANACNAGYGNIQFRLMPTRRHQVPQQAGTGL
jgi:hypothetical protein